MREKGWQKGVSMQYIISFVEGMITFISPCLLPMLPIYISYFAGGGERTTRKTLQGAFGFVIGFTIIFTSLGALAGTVGAFLREYHYSLFFWLCQLILTHAHTLAKFFYPCYNKQYDGNMAKIT